MEFEPDLMTDSEYDIMRAKLKELQDVIDTPKLKLYSCRIKWLAPLISDSCFSILDTSKSSAISTILIRLTQKGKSTSNIQVDGIEIVEIKGPFKKGHILMEYI